MSLPGYADFVLIASSAGSRVYRARQDALDRPVAVKVLELDDPESLARFRREVEVTVRLGRQHPHIVKVIDTGITPDGKPCIVMEYYDRGSLRDRLRAHGPIPVSEALEAGTVVADALHFAHRQGVLHRDVKPQNILVLPTSYVVADFGIARRIDAAQRTASMDWLTFQHASPQVLDGEQPSVADDIWSVGSTLFMLLEGQPPFASDLPEGNTALAYMKRVRTGTPSRPLRADVPPGLVRVIERCMRQVREDRFPDAAALRDALREVVAEQRSWAPSDAEQTAATARAPEAQMSPAALAHLVSAAAAAGRSTVDDETSVSRPAKPPRAARSGRSRVLLGTALALVLAGALGIGAALLARGSASPLATGAPSSGTPSMVASPTRSNINNTAIAPTITAVTPAGNGAVILRWSDPTQGKATFAVVRVIKDKGEAILQVDAGTTEVTLDGLGAGPYCFLVIAFIGRDTGVSPTQCAS